jgi:hypothetical protein
MIICRECGNSAESVDGFCSSCGVLLEWSGEPAEAVAGVDRAQRLAARRPAAERARPGPVPLVTEPVHAGPYCSACGVRNPAQRTLCQTCGELLRPGAVTPAPAGGWWRRLLARLRGGRSSAAAGLPGPSLPGTSAGMAAADGPRLGPPPTAGLPSAGMPPAAGPGFGARAAGAYHQGGLPGSAGPRIRRARPPGRVTLSRFAPVLLVAGLLGIGLGPARAWLTVHALGLDHRARAEVSQHFEDVVPISASASSSAHGHPARLAIDGIQQTYWLTRGASGTSARLRIRFASPQRIDRVGLLSGEPGGAYRAKARPETIELSAGQRRPVTLSFDDTSGFQNRPVSLRHVTVITVVIKEAYAGQKGQAVALRELEFFARR